MAAVVCWCCEFFEQAETLSLVDGFFTNGFCTYKSELGYSESAVCHNFVLRQGLFTKRGIPDYCYPKWTVEDACPYENAVDFAKAQAFSNREDGAAKPRRMRRARKSLLAP